MERITLTRKAIFYPIEVILNGCRSYRISGDSIEVVNEEQYLKALGTSHITFESDSIDSILLVLTNCTNVQEVWYKDRKMSVEEAINFFTKKKEI